MEPLWIRRVFFSVPPLMNTTTSDDRMNKTTTEEQEAPAQAPVEKRVEETPFEAVASICSVLVVGLFILTFLGQNFVIPSGSMENTLLVGAAAVRWAGFEPERLSRSVP